MDMAVQSLSSSESASRMQGAGMPEMGHTGSVIKDKKEKRKKAWLSCESQPLGRRDAFSGGGRVDLLELCFAIQSDGLEFEGIPSRGDHDQRDRGSIGTGVEILRLQPGT